MKDIIVIGDFVSNEVIMNKNIDDTSSAFEEEIEQLKTQFSKSEGSNDTAWNSSVLRVLFKNESFARKYRVKIEKFLNDLLEEGEKFVVYHPTHKNDEKEFKDNHQAFHIDKIIGSSDVQQIPVYSSSYEDTLNCKLEVVTETVKEEKVSMMTCFNCLGTHHMKKCPDKLNWARINSNKKDMLGGNTVRYHTEEQNNCSKPGTISNNLRNALGLKSSQLPKFVYHMRVIGYPPGWMDEAILEKSGLSLFDRDGKVVHDEHSPQSEMKTLYDGSKFVNFPGFNSPVPKGFTDEWEAFDMPPLQSHQQLKEALKSPNVINSKNMYKRRQSLPDKNDVKKHKNAVKTCSTPSKVNDFEKECFSPEQSSRSIDFNTPDSKPKRLSLSISKSPGTPVLDQSNPFQRLPDADKFSQGITEHLPFENLPDSVGTYEKMRGVISDVQKKLNDIKNS